MAIIAPRRLVILGFLLGALLLSACGAVTTTPASGAAPQASSAAQTSEGGQVTVKVTWGGPTAGPLFMVALDTHAVDLDGSDLAKLAILRVDGRDVAASGWDAPKGGHHREGKLVFPTNGTDGKPTLGVRTKSVEIVVRDVAGVPERTFRWAL